MGKLVLLMSKQQELIQNKCIGKAIVEGHVCMIIYGSSSGLEGSCVLITKASSLLGTAAIGASGG